jgi:phosphotriesterase-related protein
MKIRTVLGDRPADQMGAVYVHEHLILDSALISRDFAHIRLDSVDDAVAELEPCRAAGVGAMVDAMPCAGGRRVEKLADISRRSRISIIATTGLHTSKYYAHHPWADTATPEELAELFVADIEQGIDRYDYTGPVVRRTEHRAGIIKVATSSDLPTDRDRRLFAAAVAAAKLTGVPILTHCEDGRGAMQQVLLLESFGMPLHRVVLSHTDKVRDTAYHTDLLESGVNLEYDQALRQVQDEDSVTVFLVREMIDAGFVGQLMLGTDGARRSLWTVLEGSPGLAWLRTGFVDRLRDRGVGEEDLVGLFEENPQGFLSMEDPPS